MCACVSRRESLLWFHKYKVTLTKDLWLLMDGIALNGPDIGKDCLKPWNRWKFQSKVFEKYFQMDKFIDRKDYRTNWNADCIPWLCIVKNIKYGHVYKGGKVERTNVTPIIFFYFKKTPEAIKNDWFLVELHGFFNFGWILVQWTSISKFLRSCQFFWHPLYP